MATTAIISEAGMRVINLMKNAKSAKEVQNWIEFTKNCFNSMEVSLAEAQAVVAEGEEILKKF